MAPNYSKATPFHQSIIIPNNGNMLVIGGAWSFTFGTEAKQNRQRSLYNNDQDNSMVKVQE